MKRAISASWRAKRTCGTRDKPSKPAFPRDVEEVIYEIPQVKEVAVGAVAGHPLAFVIAGKESAHARSGHRLLQAPVAARILCRAL